MPDFAYDAVRYSNYPYAQTHPDRLATVAILHGLEPPDPFTARVLGDRLRRRRQPDGDGRGDARASARSASTSPPVRSRTVSAAIAEIGLRNVELRQGDVRDLTDGAARRVRLRRRPRRLRLDPGGRARRAAGDDRGEPRAGRDRVRLLQRAARRLLPPHAARRGSVARARGRPQRRSPARRRRRSSTRSSRSSGRRPPTRTARCSSASCRRSPTARSTGSSTTTSSEFWHPAVVRRVRRARRAPRARLRRRGGPLRPAHRDAAGRASRPSVWQLAGGDRVAFENYTDLLTARHFRQSVLCHAGGRGHRRPGAGAHRAPALGGAPEGRAVRGRPARRRLRRARPRAAPRTLAFAELHERLGADAARWPRRCSTASGASA